MVEDEPGVYLLPSYLANLDARVKVTATKGNRSAYAVVKEPGAPLPGQASLVLPSE